MNIECARTNMIKQQLRTWDINCPRILELFAKMPREDFLPPELAPFAFSDAPLPIGHEQYTLPPKMEAKILQALAIEPHEKILEIGTGCGFFTALLAQLGENILSLDVFRSLTQNAEKTLAKHQIKNATLITGNGYHAWPDQAPYDVIVFTASTSTLHPSITAQLKTGGRLLCTLGKAPAMKTFLYTKHSESNWKTDCLFETVIPPLLKDETHCVFSF
jgi:protein-L-isoaspartate(D-aspartate) O-methyltransferase